MLLQHDMTLGVLPFQIRIVRSRRTIDLDFDAVSPNDDLQGNPLTWRKQRDLVPDDRASKRAVNN
jgi:hypothetical protein